eukprot:TRINITY_DN383_c0_g1_i1.p1 TRINITY_DN383_c0_g1~~TRINITY_DN383_c0_g1_i1.p1  ORF type:complete len:346 (-),score=93.69 TRINITY_DN383_c0_g1_i1:85-1122(-)
MSTEDRHSLFGRISAEASPSGSTGDVQQIELVTSVSDPLHTVSGMAMDEEEFKRGMDSLVDNDHLDDVFPKKALRSNSVPMAMDKKGLPSKLVSKLFRPKKSLRARVVEETDQVSEAHLNDPKVPVFIKTLMREALGGDVEAQFTLGYCFDIGTAGVRPITNEAIYWYTKAADADHPIAQNNLGVIFSTGHRGRSKKDWAEALHWYMKAAEKGNPNAQFHAGLAYMNGEGVEARDDSQAFLFFKKAAKQGHVLAMSNVGAMYMGGRGVEKNHKKAYKWLKKAAAKEDAVACHNLGVMYMKGLGVLQDVELGEGYVRTGCTGKNSGIIPKDLSLLTKRTGSTLYNS